jgi:hypothetical protein
MTRLKAETPERQQEPGLAQVEGKAGYLQARWLLVHRHHRNHPQPT